MRKLDFSDGFESSTEPTQSATDIEALELRVDAAETDIDTLQTDLTAHTGASTGVHGVSGSVVGTTSTQTLTNKTLTAPVISTISNTGTVTLPTATDTLVGRATSDTLTNKSINGSNNTITNVSLTTAVTGTLPIANGGTGQTSANSSLNALLPSQTGNNNLYLKSDGTNTSWASAGGNLSVVSKSSTDTLTNSNDVVLCDASSAAFTINLFTASGNTGKRLYLKKTDSTFNAITIDGSSSETIDGATTTTLNTQWESVELVSDGSNWVIMARKIDGTPKSFTPTYSASWGTVTGSNFTWSRQGAYMLIQGTWTPGTTTGAEARISWPSGPTTPSSLPTTVNVGTFARSSSGSAFYSVLVEASVGYLTFSEQSGTQAGTSKRNANDFASSGVRFILTALVPINGWNT